MSESYLNKALNMKKKIPMSWISMFVNPEHTDVPNFLEKIITRNIVTAVKNGNLEELIIYVLKVNSPEINKIFRNELLLKDEKFAAKFDKLSLFM